MTTALVIVDMQNAFCSPTGSFARRGLVIEGIDRVVGTCRRLLALAASSGWDVVATRLCYRPDYRDAGLLVARNPAIRELAAYVDGSWDAELIDALSPLPLGALVVRKTRYDPFCGTELEAELRARGIDDLVVCGVTTHVCVESTIRRAHDLDFPVRIVVDAVASHDPALHRASLATLSRHFATPVTLAELTGCSGAGA